MNVEAGTCVQLFDASPSNDTWVSFAALDYECSVVGAIHEDGRNPAVCGMPLGGIDTGCIDLETSGLWGYSTIFNSHVPRGEPSNTPAFGMRLNGRTWVLSTLRTKVSSESKHVVESLPGVSGDVIEAEGVERVSEIRYWGHYPIADLEFEMDGPIEASLRAFSPFIPGYLDDSMIPGTVFELRVCNKGDDVQTGSVAFQFDGPTPVEAGEGWARNDHTGAWSGCTAGSAHASYAIGAIGEEVRTGAALAHDWQAWQRIDSELPAVDESHRGASAAVDISLQPGESRVIRFVLAWYSPQWRGGGHPSSTDTNSFTHMYATRVSNAAEAADRLAKDHESLLRRTIAWQSEIYSDDTLPDWLQDSLVNILHLIAEDGMWAAKTDVLGDWVRAEDGIFGLNESPRGCPQIECLPCTWYGSFPLVYFFPQLALSTLRTYKAYQDEEGCPPWVFGGVTCKTPVCEMTMPERGYQVAQNPTNYADMVDRYWQCTGDQSFLDEFYQSVRDATDFMIGMNSSEDGIVSFPDHWVTPEERRHIPWETEAFEHCEWAGMATHLGAMKLAHLRIVERMAESMGDSEYQQKCAAWFEQGSRTLETKLWADGYYLNWKEEGVGGGRVMDAIFGYQLDGQWIADLHGVDPVFREDRITTVLETIRRTGGSHSEHGVVNFCNPDGSAMTADQPFLNMNYEPHDFFTPEALMLGMTYIYRGDREYGMNLGQRCMQAVVRDGRSWDQPNIVNGRTGAARFGNDYYQNLIVWSFPAALHGQSLATITADGGLVQRIIARGAP